MHAEHSSHDTVSFINYFLWRSVGRNLQVAYLIVDKMHAEHSSHDTVPLISYFLWRSVGRNLHVAYP
jgi:hypothetical protein